MNELEQHELIANTTPDQELVAMAGAFIEAITMVHGIPVDFDGLSLNILRCPDTFRLMAVIITPVDQADPESEPKPRYKVDPGKIRAADVPKIVLAS